MRVKGTTLKFTCFKCTRTATYEGEDAMKVLEAVKKLGWARQGGMAVCPKCPARRK